MENQQIYDSIVIMGKRPAPGVGPVELQARAAMGVLLIRCTSRDAVLFCVEGYDLPDIPLSGSEVVQQYAIRAGVPEEQTLVRGGSNCTSLELEIVAQVLLDLGSTTTAVVTHPYHARRVRRYLRDSGLVADVYECSIKTFFELSKPDENQELLRSIKMGRPKRAQLVREVLAEIVLSALHIIDPKGIFERRLSDRVRGSGRVQSKI